MKYLIYIATIVLPFISIAKGNMPHIYGEVGGGGGNFAHVKLGLNALIAGKHTIGLACYTNFRNARDIPQDYAVGQRIQYIQEMCIYGAANYGRIAIINNTYRFNVRGGAVVGIYEYPSNFSQQIAGLASSYTYTLNTAFLVGIIANPSVEFTFTRGWGLSAGPQICINNRQAIIGFEVNTIFGKLR